MTNRKLPEKLLIRFVIYPIYWLLKPIADLADKGYHTGNLKPDVKKNYEKLRPIYDYYLRCIEEEINVK